MDTAGAVALRRAGEFAAALSRPLCVVHVVERQALAADSLTKLRRWAHDVARVDPWRAYVRVGTPLAATLGLIDELGASMVVVGGRSSWRRPTHRFVWTAVARERGLPILSACRRHKTGRILAATDLRDTKLPAVTAAARLAARLSVDVTLVHNEDPSPQYSWQAQRLPLARRRTLIDLVRSQKAIIRAVLTRTSAVDEGILSTARGRDFDLIVLAAHSSSRGHTSRPLRTADRIVARAHRSVLVVPAESAKPRTLEKGR
ncbi:MAG: universal stress protein [Myxococcales bacterium]|nr:universal stress protein [Myxococcales bacterium]